YDNLTRLFDQVTTGDLPNYFKPNTFDLGQPAPKRTELPPGHPGVQIERDKYEVPHVFGGDNWDDVMFGAGWVTAEDRGLLMDIFRGLGRIAALDVPGPQPVRTCAQLPAVRSDAADRGIP